MRRSDRHQAVYKMLVVLFLFVQADSTLAEPVSAFALMSMKGNLISPHTASEKEPDRWSSIHPYIAQYNFILDGDKLGHATRTLSKNNNQWRLETIARATKFLLKLHSNESSEFHIDHQQLISDKFSSSSKITFGKKKVINQVFDWVKKTETGNKNKKKWVIPLDEQVFDRVSHLIQMRVDLQQGLHHFDYPVSHKGAIHQYTYKLDKKETLKTELGDLSTQKFVRQNSGEKTFAIWFAPELGYFPIKITQSKKDGSNMILLLKSLDLQ